LTKAILASLALMTLLSGCIPQPEEISCVKVALYVAHESGVEEIPLPFINPHERRIGDGMRLRGVGSFKQHAYLEAYTVCKSIESGNGVKTGRL
jgi:hypothetical protein